MSAAPVVPAGPADVAAAAELIAEAFHPLPAAAWLVPDPSVRSSMLAGQFAILVAHALRYGSVHWTGDRRGVAVWFDRTGPAPEPPDYERRLAAACGDATPRFQTLDELLDKHHPADPGHHHLAFLAVTPAAQGGGLGSALLRHHQAHLDAHGIPAYLEASSERGRDLYAGHGYRSGEPFRLPDGTPFWPMWRPPRRS